MILETTEEYFHGELLSSFIEDFIFEECIDMMWCVRTDGITLDEIYNLEPTESIFAQEKMSGNHTSSSAGGTVHCPICNEVVAGRRFAPHLEKCMNGGKRGTKRHYDYIHDDYAGARPLSKSKSSEAIEQQDPHPKSLVIRLKLKQGVPRANTRRIGASLEEFQAGDIGTTQFNALYKEKGVLELPTSC